MLKAKYVSAIINSDYKASLWAFIAALMMGSNFLLAVFVVTADTSEKTIVLPPVVDKPFSVQGNNVSPEYIEQMSRYFAGLLLTYNKKNVKSQFDTILHYTDPSVYAGMKTNFDLDVERISRNDLASVFYIMGMHIVESTAYVRGELRGYVGSHLVSKQEKQYEFKFRYNGVLTLTGYNESVRTSVGGYEAVHDTQDTLIDVPDEQNELHKEVEVQGINNSGVPAGEALNTAPAPVSSTPLKGE